MSKTENSSENKNCQNELTKFSTDKALYRALRDNISSAFFCGCLLFDSQNQPIDIEIFDLNLACRQLFNLSGNIDHNEIKFSELLPNFSNDNFQWLHQIDLTLKNNRPFAEEHFIESLNKWISIKLITLEDANIMVLLQDLSKEKINQLKHINSEHKLIEKNNEVSQQNEVYKSLNEDLIKNNQAIQKINEQLNLSEEKFKSIFQNVFDGIFLIDEKGRISEWNKACENITGYLKDEVIQKPIIEIIEKLINHKSNKENVQQAINNAYADYVSLKNKKINTQKFDLSVLRKDQKNRQVQLLHFEICAHQKNVLGGIIRDITEYVEGEKKRHASLTQSLKLQDTILNLVKNTNADLNEHLRYINELCANALDCKFSGIWFFTSNNTKLVCTDFYNAATKEHSNNYEIPVNDCPVYFSEMQNSRLIAVQDVINDTRTKEFADSYSIPMGIDSLIDVPFWLNGEIKGVLCIEHSGFKRKWNKEEESFALMVAERISSALAREDKKTQDQKIYAQNEEYQKLNTELQNNIEVLNKTHSLLTASEDKFKAMADITPAAILIFDASNILYVNQEASILSGYAMETMLEMQIWDIVFPEDREKVIETGLSRLQGTYAPQKYEFRIVTHSGEVRWIDYAAKTIFFNDKKAIIGVALDITHRKRIEKALLKKTEEISKQNLEFLALNAELIEKNNIVENTNKKLKESETLIKRIIDTIPYPIFFKNTKFVYIDCNDAFAQAMGLEKSQIINKNVFDLSSDELAKVYYEADSDLLRNGGAQTYEAKVEFANLGMRDIIFNKSIVHVDDEPIGIVGIMTDITELRQSQEELKWKNHEIESQNEEYRALNDEYALLNEELQEANMKILKTYQKISESEEKYRVLFNSASEGFFILTDIVQDCNIQACHIFGYDRSEMIGLHPSDLSPKYQPDGRLSDVVANEKITAAFDGEAQYFYWLHKKKNGNLIDCAITLKAIYINEQKYLIATIQDITEKRKADRIIEEHKRKLSEVYQVARIGAWKLDLENKEIILSPEHQSMLGLAPENDIELTLPIVEFAQRFINNEDISVLLSSFSKISDAGQIQVSPPPVQYRITKPSGEMLYMEATAKFFDKGLVYGITHDITERKKAEEILIANDRLLMGINKAAVILLTHDNLSSAIKTALEITGITTGVDRVMLFENRAKDSGGLAFKMLFMWESQTVPGIDVSLFDGDIDYSEEGWNLLSKNNVIKNNCDGINQDLKSALFGDNPNTSCVRIPLFINEGFWGFLCLMSENNKRDWSQSEINILTNLVNSIGGAIAKQKRNEEITLAKEKAQESDKLKTAFLANMSHEIRTPMNAILGFTDLLKESGLSPQKRNEFIDIISKRGKDLLNIINDIIDISKIEAGQIKMNSIKFSLNSIIKDLFSFFESNLKLIEKNKVTLSMYTELPDESCVVVMDDIRLRQILTNLLSNAVKFTNKGSIEFGYFLKQNETRQEIIFFVKDSGIGIPKEKQEIIFDRFRQADDSTTRTYGGTGLGLAITKSLVDLMKGSIDVVSEQNKGSEFYIHLPYIPAVSVEKKEEKKSPTEAIKWANKVILIVEDDNVNFLYLKSLLRNTQVKILRAENGVDAIKVCQEHEEINMVLMDMQMPIMNGFEATKQIKEFRNSLPIIAQTAYAMAEDREKCLQAGCNDYITKPIDVKSLISISAKYLND